jgi:hypothetical protein
LLMRQARTYDTIKTVGDTDLNTIPKVA